MFCDQVAQLAHDLGALCCRGCSPLGESSFGGGHGGMDFLMLYRMVECLQKDFRIVGAKLDNQRPIFGTRLKEKN